MGYQTNRDLLVVATGDIGAAYMGLKDFRTTAEISISKSNSQPDLDWDTYLIRRQLKPEEKKMLRTLLHGLGNKTNITIDISDGLSSRNPCICKNNLE